MLHLKRIEIGRKVNTSRLYCVSVCLFVAALLGVCVATSYAQQEQTITIDIKVSGAQNMRGWSVALAFDPEQVSYRPNSFQPTGFMPGLVPLILEGDMSIEVGGAILGADPVSGSGTIAQMQFVTRTPISATVIAITEYAVSSEDRGDQRQAVQAAVIIENAAPPSDFTGDGTVDFSDFFLFADHFGGADQRYDIVPDGTVDFGDFFLFADSFGKSGEIVGVITIPADSLTETQEVVIVGSIDTGVVGTVEVSGTIAPEDSVHVEVVGTIGE